MDLFTKEKKDKTDTRPLALRIRPTSLEEFIGQEHVLGENKLLRRAIEADRISSLILYGPPGCGKSVVASIIAHRTQSNFEEINAVTSGVQDLRRILEGAIQRKSLYDRRTILLIDEIHHFNRSQQDALLPDVEKGNIILIGITTENPYFYVNSALISRSQVFEFKPLQDVDLEKILDGAIKDKERGLGRHHIVFDKDSLIHIVKHSEGDARKALNAIELAVLTTPPDKTGEIHITMNIAEESIQKKAVIYDKKGDQHYDTISAFIKSMRGSDPDATLYWLAKMLYAGEDFRFIARRIVICAAEDVGNADPQALAIANAALQVSLFVGMPEAKIPLAQAAIYVACAPKSNASYMGIERALKDVESERVEEVTDRLKDPHADGKGRLGHGEGYLYPHNFRDHFVQQQYMLSKKRFYEPSDQGYEIEIKRRIDERNRR